MQCLDRLQGARLVGPRDVKLMSYNYITSISRLAPASVSNWLRALICKTNKKALLCRTLQQVWADFEDLSHLRSGHTFILYNSNLVHLG